jgi:hypothetical protein
MSALTSHRVNGPALWRLLDTQRRARGISWREVGRQTGVNISFFSRIHAGKGIHGDALISLLAWLRLDTDLREISQPTGGGTERGEAGSPAVEALAHTLRTSTVSELQQAFRAVGMTMTFDIAEEEQPDDRQPPSVEPGRNAEECPACDGVNRPYPFICPGHPTGGA